MIYRSRRRRPLCIFNFGASATIVLMVADMTEFCGKYFTDEN
jgi:hypothetical protein